MIKTTVALCFLVLAGQAWAVNKCTALNGKVQFQDAPCAALDKAQMVQVVPSHLAEDLGRWEFDRSTDSMTGKTACKAYSPAAFVHARGRYDYVRVEINALPLERFLATVEIVRSSQDVFHNSLAGMGIKSDPGTFSSLDIKVGQKSLATSQNSKAIDQMLAARSLRLRLRFWPYEDLIDSPPIPTTGLQQAVVLAAQCAKTLS